MTTASAPSRAALVTGCSSGIGRAAALALHDAGHEVYATARRPETLSELAERGLTVLALDVTDETSMTAAVERVVAECGAVGVLVNNAGYSMQAVIEQGVLDEVRREFETNVFGLTRMIQLVLPGMRAQRWGRIINIGSMGGRFTFPGGGFYHASKHAVEAISDALRLEVAPFGVKVSLVQPGPVQTEFGTAALDTMDPEDDGPYEQFNDEVAARLAQAYGAQAAGRRVTPEAVARTIVAAAGEHPRSRYAVGAVAKALITTRRLTPDVVWDRFMRRVWPTPHRPTGGPG